MALFFVYKKDKHLCYCKQSFLYIHKKTLIVAISGERQEQWGSFNFSHYLLYMYFFLLSTVNRLSGPWKQEAFTFFSLYFSVKKKKLMLTFYQTNYYVSLRTIMKDGRKIWRNAYHVLNEKQM